MLLLYITLYNSVKRYKENNRYCPIQPTTRSSSNSLFMMLHTKIRQSEVVEALFNLGLCISQSLAFVQAWKSTIDLDGSDNQEVWALILKLDGSLNTASKAITQQNKPIRITDKSEAGRAAVDEYFSDEVALESKDEKKICAAEERALKKKKTARFATLDRS